MRYTKTILATAILSIALVGNSLAQTVVALAPTPVGTGSAVASPTPNPMAGTFQDNTLTVPQRIALANTALTSGTGIGLLAPFNAAVYMLQARPVSWLMAAYPKFAAGVMADPTLGGITTSSNQVSQILALAIMWQTATNAVLTDQIAYLGANMNNPSLMPGAVIWLKLNYGKRVSQQAQAQYAAGDYAGAITTATSVLGYGDSGAMQVIFNCKIALRSPDVLSWAKLIYTTVDFGHTQAGIDAVSSAYRSLDCNVVRANAFIAYQTSGTGANPISGVALPTGINFIPDTPAAVALNYGVAGDNLSALKTAVSSFASAQSGAPLNTATAFVAQWLRNIDGNVVRANAFIQAQSQGLPYTITELSGN